MAARDGEVLRIEGVGSDSIQGDIRFVEAAVAMGARVRSGPGWLEVQERGRWPLAGITLDCNHIPDAAMTLAVMALYADSPTRLSGIASWRVKETDRIAAMAAELRKLGAQVVEGADFIDISPPARWASAAVHTYDDHRMAMCLSLAAFNPLAGANCAQRILDPRCVAKTFPDYFEALFSVARADAEAIPVITIDGPTASARGPWPPPWPGPWATTCWTLAPCTVRRAWPRSGTASSPTTRPAWPGWRASLRCASATVRMAAAPGCADVKSAMNCAPRPRGCWPPRVSALPAVREALQGLQLAFRSPPRPGGRWARHGHHSPGRHAQGLPDGQPRTTCDQAA